MNQEIQGEIVYERMAEWLKSSPGLLGDHIVMDGKRAYVDNEASEPSGRYVYSGYGAKRELYEVWVKPSHENGGCAQICARVIAFGHNTLRGGRKFRWTSYRELFVEDDNGIERQISWDSTYCEKCGRQ